MEISSYLGICTCHNLPYGVFLCYYVVCFGIINHQNGKEHIMAIIMPYWVQML